ncbi:dTDP-4-dehydrorhamnose reductase [Halosimplex halophilum]|uniref:dTDP-4-dehydrorhamnose reductase n=1 Tax=Halosimplex halophilum TaxID=2559572 RepID=UPI00107FA548|nr:dTDP-4-dehydrorhamnose reductase [Halosimplex halophilum]
MDLLVVGGTGLLGTNVRRDARARDVAVAGTSRSPAGTDCDHELDKTDPEAVERVVEAVDPDAVVDTAAFHDVDACETDRATAWEVNAAGTAAVARAADAAGAHYVFVSTDYVFPGDPAEAPYRATDPVDPCNYYAETKFAGECAARLADHATVVRPSVVYGLANDNFLTWVLGELDAGEPVGIVDDQTSAPTYAPDLARALVDIVDRGLTGTYHATGPESVSRYEFTVTLAETLGFDTDLVDPITTEELGQQAPRPTDSTLDSAPLYEALGWTFREPATAFEAIGDRRE